MKMPKSRIITIGLMGCIFLAINIYAFPLWTGQVFSESSDHLPGSRIKIPWYYGAFNDFLERTTDANNDQRVVVLPDNDISVPGIVSLNLDGRLYGGADPLTRVINRPEILLSRFVTFKGDFLDKLWNTYKYDPKSFFSLLPSIMHLINAKYVVVRNDSTNQVYPNIRTPQEMSEYLRNYSSLQMVNSFGQLDVYTDPLADQQESMHIYAATKPISIVGSTESIIPLLDRNYNYLTDKSPLVFMDQQNQILSENPQSLAPLVDNTASFVFHRQQSAELVLHIIDQEYHHDTQMIPRLSFYAQNREAYAIIANVEAGSDPSLLTPVIEPVKNIAPDLSDPLIQLLSSGREWRYYGDVFLDQGNYQLEFLKQDPNPLKGWKGITIKQGNIPENKGFDLFETVLPDDVPEDYTTRSDKPEIVIYKDGQALTPSWNIEVSAERSFSLGNRTEFYQVGKDYPRQVIISIPSGEFPEGTYTIAYVLPELGREISNVVIVPTSVFQEKAKYVLSLFERNEYRISYFFTDFQNPFYIPNAANYYIAPRISPNIWQSVIYLLPKLTDWSNEFFREFQFQGTTTSQGISQVRTGIQPLIFLGQNWYAEESDSYGKWHWGENNMHLFIINPYPQPVEGTFTFHVTSIIDRYLQITVNGVTRSPIQLLANSNKTVRTIMDPLQEFITGRPIPPFELQYPPQSTEITLDHVTLTPGENEIMFYTTEGTDLMDDLLKNGDMREVSIKIWDNIQFNATQIPKFIETTEQFGNTEFSASVNDRQLMVSSYFNGDGREQEYLLMSRDFSGQRSAGSNQSVTGSLDLEQWPYFRLNYTVNNPVVATIDAAFGIDDNGDGQVDGYVIANSTPAANGMQIALNLFETAKQRFPDPYYKDHQDLKVVQMFLILHKQWGLDVKNTGKTGLYTFRLGDFNFYNDQSLVVPGYTRLLGTAGELAQWSFSALPPVVDKGADGQNPPVPASQPGEGSGNPTAYETRLTSDGTLLVSESFQSPLLSLASDTAQTGVHTTFVLRTPLLVPSALTQTGTPAPATTPTPAGTPEAGSQLTQLTGEVEREDATTIYLKNVVELGGQGVAIAKDNISLTFAPERRLKQFAPEGLTMRTDLAGPPESPFTPPDTTFLEGYPFLGITYKLQDPAVQMLGVALEVDTNGDGTADTTLFPGTAESIKDWRYAGSFGSIDLYEATLSERFPQGYTTDPASPQAERFIVTHLPAGAEAGAAQTLTPTWGGWSYDQSLVQVGYDQQARRVQINVPKGAVPQGDYVVHYLPEAQASPLYEGYDTLEINVQEVLAEAQAASGSADARPWRLTGLALEPRRLSSADVSAPDKKGSYTFFFKDLYFYKKLPYPVKVGEMSQAEQAEIAGLFKSPLVRLDGQPLAFTPSAGQANLLDRNGYWLEPVTVNLSAGLHQDGMDILPTPTFKVDLVELANKPYVPQAPKADVTFEKINPTRYDVDVNAWDNFWLVFSESFHPGWTAYIVDDGQATSTHPWYEWSALLTWIAQWGKRTELTDHYLVNAYANGWYVPKTGKYHIVLEYWPQRLFEVGVIISVATLLACLGYLVRSGWQGWRRKRARVPGIE